MKQITIKSTYPPTLVKRNGWTRIVAGTITEVNGQPWSHPYVAVRGETLESSDIVWLRPAFKAQKPRVEKVNGSNGNIYTVTTFGNGSKTCTCPGFQYRRFCKHTGAK